MTISNLKKAATPYGFTLVELMMVVVILSILASIVTPRFDLLLQRAHQAKAKGNLGNLRTALGLYYSDQEGRWPLSNATTGYAYLQNMSMTNVIVPKYFERMDPPRVVDRTTFNGLGLNYDDEAIVSMNPNYSPAGPKDVFILTGAPTYTPFVDAPYVYDNVQGLIYICNGNYDASGNYFYTW